MIVLMDVPQQLTRFVMLRILYYSLYLRQHVIVQHALQILILVRQIVPHLLNQQALPNRLVMMFELDQVHRLDSNRPLESIFFK